MTYHSGSNEVLMFISNFFHVNFLLLSQGQYSLARAQQSFKSLVQIHEKNGEYYADLFS